MSCLKRIGCRLREISWGYLSHRKQAAVRGLTALDHSPHGGLPLLCCCTRVKACMITNAVRQCRSQIAYFLCRAAVCRCTYAHASQILKELCAGSAKKMKQHFVFPPHKNASANCSHKGHFLIPFHRLNYNPREETHSEREKGAQSFWCRRWGIKETKSG